MDLTNLQVRVVDGSRQSIQCKSNGKEYKSSLQNELLLLEQQQEGEVSQLTDKAKLYDSFSPHLKDANRRLENLRKLRSCAQARVLRLARGHELPSLRLVAGVLDLLCKLSNNVHKRKHARDGQGGQVAKARRLEEGQV